MDDEAPITREEMIALFGEARPREADTVLAEAPDHWTLGQARAEVRRIGLAAREARLRDGQKREVEYAYASMLRQAVAALTRGEAEPVWRGLFAEADAYRDAHPAIIKAYEDRLGVSCLRD